MNAPTRPVLRWHGGKWRMAPWIISHFPAHRIYVEPFGGAASVLIRKPRSHGEIYNDLDDRVVGLFRVLRNEVSARRLKDLLRLTPFARQEFLDAYEPADDPIESARRLVVRSFMGFGSNAHSAPEKGRNMTGFRANANRNGTTPAQDWANYPTAMDALIARLAGVIIEHRPALDVMHQHDGPSTLHYVDPPYIHATRAQGDAYEFGRRMYAHEMADADHVTLLEALQGLEGMVVLSGYAHPLYDDALADWRRLELETYADGARPRTEVLWLNQACHSALHHQREQLEIFAGAAE
ncbi:DNA adenine methylase [Pleomorphomonas oryzae]|uniref:DNA adenine methylase n=1 Tax=Pleomorphomonas oryzae TaxID=261934 RepID=UPI00041F9131|nr:DNA adenine methylase [Pleomorphomonas oryzae]